MSGNGDWLDYEDTAHPTNDWIEWTGGDNPAFGKHVEYQLRDEPSARLTSISWLLSWKHTGGPDDIVRWRPLDISVRETVQPNAGDKAEP